MTLRLQLSQSSGRRPTSRHLLKRAAHSGIRGSARLRCLFLIRCGPRAFPSFSRSMVYLTSSSEIRDSSSSARDDPHIGSGKGFVSGRSVGIVCAELKRLSKWFRKMSAGTGQLLYIGSALRAMCGRERAWSTILSSSLHACILLVRSTKALYARM